MKLSKAVMICPWKGLTVDISKFREVSVKLYAYASITTVEKPAEVYEQGSAVIYPSQ